MNTRDTEEMCYYLGWAIAADEFVLLLDDLRESRLASDDLWATFQAKAAWKMVQELAKAEQELNTPRFDRLAVYGGTAARALRGKEVDLQRLERELPGTDWSSDDALVGLMAEFNVIGRTMQGLLQRLRGE